MYFDYRYYEMHLYRIRINIQFPTKYVNAQSYIGKHFSYVRVFEKIKIITIGIHSIIIIKISDSIIFRGRGVEPQNPSLSCVYLCKYIRFRVLLLSIFALLIGTIIVNCFHFFVIMNYIYI